MSLPVLRRLSPVRAWAWATGGAVVVLAVSWWEILFLPLGDSHDGRIHGRFGLQVQNLLDDGLIGSNFLASMEPFAAQPYAHHPPLLNGVHAVVSGTLGVGEWQLHLVGFLAGLATVAALVWLMRELGLGGWAAFGATALVAATPMFWIYARLGLGISLMLVFLALFARRRRLGGEGLDRWLIAVGAVTAFSSWPGAALVLVVALVGRRIADIRRVSSSVLIAAAGAVAITLLWALSATSVSELGSHTGDRLRIPVSIGEFVEQYRWFYGTLFPGWFKWTIPLALAAGVANPRTRLPTAALAGVTLAWTIALPEAAYVHDFWTYPLLGPVALGWGAALDWLSDRGIPQPLIPVAIAVLVVVTFVDTQQDGFREAYFHAAADAGALVQQVGPAPDQAIAWVAGSIEVPRWLSFYWDLPTEKLEADTVSTASAGDRVLLRLDRPPDWVVAVPEPEAQVGRYVVVRAGDLAGLLP